CARWDDYDRWFAYW
nr:immunoglobulin heavy chain junction region [Mus musculus]